MKDNVDKRVVEFEFDNSKFDKNVKKSTKTLDKFNETLQFKDVSKSLDVINHKFTVFEIATASAIKNITDRVVNLGIRLIKSLSIDNIAAGWDKFGQKTIAVGTLMSQTLKVAGKEIENYSEKMGIVNDQLDKLNWFTDETSYNFTDMVDNIGKFTAAGQDLDKSVEAMMGIANWAALSGQNAVTASRAMYQLSQALGKGYVQLLDWKSIQTANMDTQEFRKVVLETAVSLGELTKQGENFISKTGKKFTINQFSEQLSAKWFTSDVLTESLKKYSAAVDKLYEITEREGITASEAMELYADQFDEFAIKAFKAAQEARTFSDAINSVKDAVSTGWMTTAEMIFGGYEEARKFWTDLANELYDVFATSGEIRNSILEVWEALDGRTDLFEHGGEKQGAFWNLYDSVIAVRDMISDAWDAIFPSSEFENQNDQIEDMGHNLKSITSGWQKATAKLKDFLENNKDLQKILEGVFSVLRGIAAAAEMLRYALDPIIYTAKQIVLTLSGFLANIGEQMASATGYAEGLYEIAEAINVVLTKIFTVIDLPKVLTKIADVLRIIASAVKTVFTTIGDFLSEHVDITKFIETISNALSNLTKTIKDFFAQLKKGMSGGTTSVSNAVAEAVGGSGGRVAGATMMRRQLNRDDLEIPVNEEETIEPVQESITILSVLTDLLKSFGNLLKGLYAAILSVLKITSSIINVVSEALQALPKKLEGIADDTEKIVDALKIVLYHLIGALIIVEIVKVFLNLKWMYEYLQMNLFSFLEEAASALSRWGSAQIIKSIGKIILMIATSFLLIVTGIKQIQDLKLEWKDLNQAFAIIGVMTLAMILLSITSKALDGSYRSLTKQAKNWKWIHESSQGSTISEIGSALIALGISFWLISKGLESFKEIDPEIIKMAVHIIGVLGVLCVALQLLSRKVTTGTKSVRKMLPSVFQILGFALSLKLITKQLIEFTKITEEFSEETAEQFKVVLHNFVRIIAMLLIVNNLTKQSIHATGNLSGNVITLGSRLGFTLFGVATVLASLSLYMYTLKDLGISAADSLVWASEIMDKIIKGTIALQLVSNIGFKTISKNEKKGLFSKTENPIAKVLTSIGWLLLSISVSLRILQNVEITENVLTILDNVKKFLIHIIGFLGIVSIISNIILKIGKSKKIQSAGSIVSDMVKSVSVMLLAMTVAVAVLSIIPDYDKVKQIGIALMIFVTTCLTILAITAAFMRKSTKATGKTFAKRMLGLIPMLTAAAAVVATILLLDGISTGRLIAVSALILVTLGVMAKITKKFNDVVGASTKWGTIGKRILGMVPMLLALGAVVAAMMLLKDANPLTLLSIAAAISLGLLGIIAAFKALSKIKIDMSAILKFMAGMALLSLNLLALMASFGVGIKVLAWGLKQLVNPMNDLTAEGVKNLKNLLLWLSLIGVTGMFAIIGNSSLGVGMKVLGWGLANLVNPMNALTAEGVKNLRDLLLWMSVTGISGILGIVGNSSLGTGLYVLGWGLSNLVNPINNIKADGVKNLKNLLLWMSLTGITGILAALGNSSLGLGMETLGWGLSNLVDPMSKLTADGVDNLKSLLLWMSLTGLTGILAALGNFMIGVGMESLAVGLNELIDPMNKLEATSVDNLVDLLLELSKTGFTGILGALGNTMLGIGMDALAGGLNNLSISMNTLKVASIGRFKDLMDYLSETKNNGLLNIINGDRAESGMNSLANGLNTLVNSLDKVTDTKLKVLDNISSILYRIISIKDIAKEIKQAFADLGNIISNLINSFDDYNDDLVIKPVIDLSNFESGYNRLSSMLSQISGQADSVSSKLAFSVGNNRSNANPDTETINNTNNYNDVYNVTMNIESNDPYEIANEVDRILQIKHINTKLAKGGV